MSGPKEFEVTKSRSFGFEEDKRRLAIVMYCYLKKEIPHGNNRFEFTPVWPGEHKYDYRTVQLKHLIKLMSSDMQFPCISYLAHPLFMTIEEMVSFEDRMRMVLKGNYMVRRYLDSFGKQVYRTKWTEQLTDDVLVSIRALNPEFETSLSALIAAIRNRRHHHRGEDPQWRRAALGPMHVENFEFWEKKFPSFFISLYIAMGTFSQNGIFLCQTADFVNSSFFKARPAFYVACKAVTLYETPLR